MSSYVDLVLRLARTPRPGLELSLVGQHLFDPQYPAFVSEIQDIRASELERGFRAQRRVVF